MNDLRQTIIPKSDQLNADDLIGRNLTIRVSRVTLTPDADQPVALNFEGDDGKPYKPCKSMRRVLVNVWGPDGSAYAGRSMTLYRDDKVTFGGMAVGGIRISHVSHIDSDVTMALTATRANRKPFTVRPLRVEAPRQAEPGAGQDKATTAARALTGRFEGAESAAAVMAIVDDVTVRKQRDWLREKRPELSEMVEKACAAAYQKWMKPPEDDFPEPLTTAADDEEFERALV